MALYSEQIVEDNGWAGQNGRMVNQLSLVCQDQKHPIQPINLGIQSLSTWVTSRTRDDDGGGGDDGMTTLHVVITIQQVGVIVGTKHLKDVPFGECFSLYAAPWPAL